VTNLDDIDDKPGPYCMSFGFDLQPLVKSIEKFGLINLPVTTKNIKGTTDVVLGYRRIMALKSLDWEEVPCRDFSDSGLTPMELLLLNLYDNLATRKLNEVEKGMVLARLIPYVSRGEILDHYMPLLHLPSHESTLDTLLSLDEMDEHIRHSLAEKRLSFQTIKTFVGMDDRSCAAIFKWISEVKLNFNQQSQFIEYILDLVDKEKTSVFQILGEKQLSSILESKKLNNPQKAKLTLERLKMRRFPFLTRYEKVFHKKVGILGLPEGVKIHHPPFFEGADYRLEISFKSGGELREKISFLSRLNGLGKTVLTGQEDL
jgi:hypothetical protein